LQHDLKTPLNNIKSLIEFIEEDQMIELKDGASDLFEMVKTSASSMSKLIDDLLYYSM
jgi:signal transduction histidine kinase